MKIERVTIYPYSIGRQTPFKIATMVSHSIDGVFVCVEGEGIKGWGEALPFHSINGETQGTCVESLKFLSTFLLDRNCLEIQSIVSELKRLLPSQTTAICALDMAVHDALCQELKIPLYAYMGGTPRKLPTDLTIGIVSASEAKNRATEIWELGYKTVKVKLGDGVENDVARVTAVRDVTDTFNIRVDANQAYDRETALLLLDSIAEFGIEFCEQPVKRGDWEGMKWLHNHAGVAVMADESCFDSQDAFRLISQGCCSMINVKLCKSSGLVGGREIGAVVRNGFGRCMIGGMAETRLGVTASAHLGCSDEVFQYFDLDAHVGHSEDPIDGGIHIYQGNVELPSGYGLGAKPSSDYLKKLTCIEVA